MTEEVISLETAKLAKEKGFYVYTGVSYWEEKNGVARLTNETPYYDFPNDIERYHRYTRYFAPTHALLQKWLREVHELHIDVHHFTNQKVDDELWKDVYQVFVDYSAFHPYYQTYEEALEKGIIEALKLIKNDGF